MGFHGRRPREGTSLREAILQHVLDITRTEGWHALTIRKVAERLRYSPPMIYEHFENKEALCAEVALEGYKLLYRRLSAASAGAPDSSRRLRSIMQGWRRFAWENPNYYGAMFGLGTRAPTPTDKLHVHSGACLGLLGDAVMQCANGDTRCPDSPLEAARVLMAAAHGVIALHLAGRIVPQAEADDLYQQVMEGVLAGWRI